MEFSVMIPRELVEPYPSTELKAAASAWFNIHFEGSFLIVRERQNLIHHHISYWICGARLYARESDIAFWNVAFHGSTREEVINRVLS